MVTTQYDPVAAQYARLVAPKYGAIARLVAQRAAPPYGARIVELAAGTGALTRLLAAGAGTFVAVDVSTAMLGEARASLPAHVRLLAADVAAVPFPSGAADLVVSSLGPVPDAVAAREALRLLAPGGRLVLSLWGDDYRERHLLDAARRRIGLDPCPTGSAAAAVERLRAAGFARLGTTLVRLPVVHDSIATYLDYRRAFGCAPSLPARRLDDALGAITAEARRYLDGAGRLHLDWQVVLVEAARPPSPSSPLVQSFAKAGND